METSTEKYPRLTTNEFGTSVKEYRCEDCGDVFTVTPAPSDDRDHHWTGCTQPYCESYKPEWDIDRIFDEAPGRVGKVKIGGVN